MRDEYTRSIEPARAAETLNLERKIKANAVRARAADEWEPYLQEKQAENARLTRTLAEAELNDRVYGLFDLTAEEVKLLQKEVEH